MLAREAGKRWKYDNDSADSRDDVVGEIADPYVDALGDIYRCYPCAIDEGRADEVAAAFEAEADRLERAQKETP